MTMLIPQSGAAWTQCISFDSETDSLQIDEILVNEKGIHYEPPIENKPKIE
jgi:hypothetical protein